MSAICICGAFSPKAADLHLAAHKPNCIWFGKQDIPAIERCLIAEVGKVPMDLLLMPSLREVARVLEDGNKEPGRGAFNWRHNQVLRSDMIAGAQRHILSSENGVLLDAKSGQRHTAHAVARLLILMDAEDHGTLVDTRILKRGINGTS